MKTYLREQLQLNLLKMPETGGIEEISRSPVSNNSDSGCGGSSGGESPRRQAHNALIKMIPNTMEKIDFTVNLKEKTETPSPVKSEMEMGMGGMNHMDMGSHMDMDDMDDCDSLNGSDARRKRNFVNEGDKDDNYWVKRRKNNEAARRSREKRRMNDLLLEQRVVALTEENKQLKGQLLALKLRYGELEEFKPKHFEKPGQVFTNRNGDTAATVLVNSPDHLAHFHAQAKAAAAAHHASHLLQPQLTALAMPQHLPSQPAPTKPAERKGGFSIDRLLSSEKETETQMPEMTMPDGRRLSIHPRPGSADSGNNSGDNEHAQNYALNNASYTTSLYSPMMYAHALASKSPYLLSPALMAQQKLSMAYGMN